MINMVSTIFQLSQHSQNTLSIEKTAHDFKLLKMYHLWVMYLVSVGVHLRVNCYLYVKAIMGLFILNETIWPKTHQADVMSNRLNSNTVRLHTK